MDVQAHLQGLNQIKSKLSPLVGVAAVVKTPTAVRVLSPRSISTEWRSRRVVCLPWSGGHGDGRNRLVFPCFFIRNMSLFNNVRWIINSFCNYCSCSVKSLSNEFSNSGKVRIITGEMIVSETEQNQSPVWAMLGSCWAMLSSCPCEGHVERCGSDVGARLRPGWAMLGPGKTIRNVLRKTCTR